MDYGMANSSDFTSDKKHFYAVRNRMKLHQQTESLSEIIDHAGRSLKTAQTSGMSDAAEEIRHIIGSAVYMMSALGCVLSSATRDELESDDVIELIHQADTMTGIMSSVFH